MATGVERIPAPQEKTTDPYIAGATSRDGDTEWREGIIDRAPMSSRADRRNIGIEIVACSIEKALSNKVLVNPRRPNSGLMWVKRQLTHVNGHPILERIG